jgi:hypothetical protein
MFVRRPLWPLLLAAAAVVSLCLRTARAQEPPAALWRAEVQSWVFAPAYSPGAQSIVGFLAWAQPGTTTGSNVSLLWCERHHDDTWSMHGWRTADAASAVEHARAAVGNQNLWLDHSDINTLLAQAPATAEPIPTPMFRGLFEDDPSAAILLALPDPAVAITAATTAGYPAARTLSPAAARTPESGDLTTDALLNHLTFDAETALFGQASLTLGDIGNPCWCPCTTTQTDTGWVLDGSYTENGVRRCCYRREKQTVRTCDGTHADTCAQCHSTTVLESTVLWGETVVDDEAGCPDYSQGGNPASTFPTRPSWWPQWPQ